MRKSELTREKQRLLWEVYYFSPTGGTKKVSSIFADAMEKEVIWHNLGSKEPMMEKMRKKSINLQKLSRIALL